MIKYAVLLSSFVVALSLAFSGKPVAPVGTWQVDARHSDAQLVTDATTNYGKNKINFTLGNTRVSGRVKLDNNEPSKSAFDFTMYPANSAAPAIGEDGKVRSQWLVNMANHTLVCFHSKGFVRTADGRLRTTGDLVLTRVDRNVEFGSGEAYAGPVYGPPMIHRLTRQATFVFDVPAAGATGQKSSSNDAELQISGSTNVIAEDFPQLVKAVLDVYKRQVSKLNTTRKIRPVMERTKCERWLMESAGVECGSKMLGTGLAFAGLAAHKRAAKNMPARKIITPAARLAMTPQSVLRCAFCTFFKPFALASSRWPRRRRRRQRGSRRCRTTRVYSNCLLYTSRCV